MQLVYQNLELKDGDFHRNTLTSPPDIDYERNNRSVANWDPAVPLAREQTPLQANELTMASVRQQSEHWYTDAQECSELVRFFPAPRFYPSTSLHSHEQYVK